MYLYKFIKYSKEAVCLACEEMLIQGDLEAVAFLKSNIKDERMMMLVVVEVFLQTASWIEMKWKPNFIHKHTVQSQRKQHYKSDCSNNDPQ